MLGPGPPFGDQPRYLQAIYGLCGVPITVYAASRVAAGDGGLWPMLWLAMGLTYTVLAARNAIWRHRNAELIQVRRKLRAAIRAMSGIPAMYVNRDERVVLARLVHAFPALPGVTPKETAANCLVSATLDDCEAVARTLSDGQVAHFVYVVYQFTGDVFLRSIASQSIHPDAPDRSLPTSPAGSWWRRTRNQYFALTHGLLQPSIAELTQVLHQLEAARQVTPDDDDHSWPWERQEPD